MFIFYSSCKTNVYSILQQWYLGIAYYQWFEINMMLFNIKQCLWRGRNLNSVLSRCWALRTDAEWRRRCAYTQKTMCSNFKDTALRFSVGVRPLNTRGVTRRLLHETRHEIGFTRMRRDEIFTLFLRNPQWWNIWMENSLLFNWKSQNAKQFRCILKSTCNECYFTSILMNSMQ